MGSLNMTDFTSVQWVNRAVMSRCPIVLGEGLTLSIHDQEDLGSG